MYIHMASAQKGRINEVLVKYFPRRYNCRVESWLLPCWGWQDQQEQPLWMEPLWSPALVDLPLPPPFAELGNAQG